MMNQEPSLPTTARHALVIGIDDYPYVPAQPLQGCVNDARRMAALLDDTFGFRVRLLIDTEATRDAVLGELGRIARDAGKTDVVAVHFSGHGSRIQAADGNIETFVPHDSGRDPHPNRDITDRELYGWLLRLWKKTPYVTLIFDSCHAGGIVREQTAGTRGIPEDRRPDCLVDKTAFQSEELDIFRETGPDGWRPLSERYTLLAACRSGERAREIGDPKTGCRHGAFTCFLAENLARLGETRTYRDVFTTVAPRLLARFREQHAQLEGVWDREVFGRTEPSPETALRQDPLGGSQGGRHDVLTELRSLAPNLGGVLDIELYRRAPGRAWHLEDGGLPRFESGDQLGIRLRHRHTEGLYPAIFDLGLRGAVQLLHPARGAIAPLLTGQELEIGFEPGQELELYIPVSPSLDEGIIVGGLETLVLLATTEPVDLDRLVRTGVCQELRGERPPDWAAVARTFHLRHPAGSEEVN